MKFQRPRGTNDLTPEQSPLWRYLRHLFEQISTQFGYVGVDTPVFERTELFTRTVGEDTDVVAKEMYTFADRKGRSLSLRPEATAGVVRLVVENSLLASGGTHRLCYWGPMFRYDRPQAGRYRQFHQLGVEAFGTGGAALDAETIELFVTLLREVGLSDLKVTLGSVGDDACRPGYIEILRKFLAGKGDVLCKTCLTRTGSNPLRVFDCKVPGCREAIADAPKILDHLCDDCRTHMDHVGELLQTAGISVEIDPSLVRGLDYYTRTVYEVHYPSLGAQSALGGGGRYDGLVEQCGGPATPAVGFSAGIERLILAIQSEGTLSEKDWKSRGAYLCLMCAGAEAAGGRIAAHLREAMPVEVDYTGRGLKAQLKTANNRGARFAILLGEDEIANRTATLKDLDSGEQKVLSEEQLLTLIKTWIAGETRQSGL
ncbi:MAG: histidine--tRNA ligase [bacterium]|nr:histidine--tRNA ligase [bacterium]